MTGIFLMHALRVYMNQYPNYPLAHLLDGAFNFDGDIVALDKA